MEIRIYAHELDYCGVTPMDELGVIINDKDIDHIMKTFNMVNILIDDWEYNEDSNELILYISNTI